MARNGSGTFNRLYDWTDERDAGNNIDSTKFDAEMDGMATALTDSLAKDGQTTPTDNLPMGGFKHTGVASGSSRTEYTRLDQAQDGKLAWVDAGGSADAITATYSPTVTTLVDGQLCAVRAGSANATTTPTFSPNGLTARNIVKNGGAALRAGEISGDGHELILRYDLSNSRWELLNPKPTLVGVGTNEQLLSTDGTDPTWIDRSDISDAILDDVLLFYEGKVSGGGLSYDFADLEAGYDYVFVARNLVLDTGDQLIARVSTNNGSSFIGTSGAYRYVVHGFTSDGSSLGASDGGSGATSAVMTMSNTSTSQPGFSFELRLINPMSASISSTWYTRGFNYDLNSDAVTNTAAGLRDNAEANDAFQFATLSGNDIASGTIERWRMKHR